MKREQIEKDLRNLQKVVSSFQDDLDEIKHQFEKLQDREGHTYKMGDKLRSQVTGRTKTIIGCGNGYAALVDDESGWSPKAIKVSDVKRITEEELEKMIDSITGEHFIKINRNN